MNREMQIILEVNQQAENFYDDAVLLGDHAAYALKARRRSQMTGLENVAESALKASDVLDYVKRQTARFVDWRQDMPGAPSKQGFGERLKEFLEKRLAERRDVICSEKRLNISDKTDEGRLLRRRIYLLLIRQFLRQMVAQYEYRVSLDNLNDAKKGA
jgi:hypothetical protein